MTIPDMSGYYRTVLNAIPTPVFVVEEDMVIADFNLAAGGLLDGGGEALRRRGGDAMHCIHAQETPEGCGHAHACRDCVIRNSVNQSLAGYALVQQRTRMEFVLGGRHREAHLLVTTSPFDYLGQRLVLLILEDVSELVRLRSLLPICAKCKRIRDDGDYWQQVEVYFKHHADVDFCQSVCPDCVQGFLSSDPATGKTDTSLNRAWRT